MVGMKKYLGEILKTLEERISEIDNNINQLENYKKVMKEFYRGPEDINEALRDLKEKSKKFEDYPVPLKNNENTTVNKIIEKDICKLLRDSVDCVNEWNEIEDDIEKAFLSKRRSLKESLNLGDKELLKEVDVNHELGIKDSNEDIKFVIDVQNSFITSLIKQYTWIYLEMSYVNRFAVPRLMDMLVIKKRLDEIIDNIPQKETNSSSNSPDTMIKDLKDLKDSMQKAFKVAYYGALSNSQFYLCKQILRGFKNEKYWLQNQISNQKRKDSKIRRTLFICIVFLFYWLGLFILIKTTIKGFLFHRYYIQTSFFSFFFVTRFNFGS